MARTGRIDADTTPGIGEVLAVWSVIGALVASILVTYSRLPAADLYNTSVEGLRGGAGRALVQTNFPSVSLVAIALVLIAVSVLPRGSWWIAAPAIALCLVTAWPGQVKQSDLDARVVNVLPALGVLLALALTIWATRRTGAAFAPSRPGDTVRIVVAAVAVVISAPWIAAELGFYLGNSVFLTSRVITEGDETLPAVHLGHHHGLDGTVLILFALLLSRVRVSDRRLDAVLLPYVALMFGYGAVNAFEDGWHEQVVKRGWMDWKLPSALIPRFHWVWLVTLAITALAYLAFRLERRMAENRDNRRHERAADGLPGVRQVREG
jgi:hypothetical protein